MPGDEFIIALICCLIVGILLTERAGSQDTERLKGLEAITSAIDRPHADNADPQNE